MRTLLFVFLLSGFLFPQTSSNFSIGGGGGLSPELFNEDEFKSDVVMFREEGVKYNFDNSYNLKLWINYKINKKFLAVLSISYLPNFKGFYSVRDHLNDMLIADYKIEFISSTLNANYLIDEQFGFKIYLGAGAGWLRRIKNIDYSTKVSGVIYKGYGEKTQRDDGILLLFSFIRGII